MASSYINNLRLAEMATGDASGTWGTVTNTNLTLIADALGYQSKTVASASTDTLTIPDGTETDNEAISLYVKLTGGNQACTITVGPNTVKKLWIIENATSQVITLTQGSGANVILAAGVTKMIYADGAGSGAALTDALVGLEVGTTLYIKNAATGDDSTAQLFLQTAEADIQANDVLGKINFQAPNEGTGTDAILVAASIQAVSEGDFSSSSNASSIKFTTASSAAAAIGGTDGGEMSLLSNGALLIRDKRTNGAPTLALESGRTDVSDGEVLAGIEMYAPVEASGTDAILVGAAIKAIADADFSSSSNATSLQFQTGASATATTRFAIASDGSLSTPTLGTSNVRFGVNAGNSIESGGNYNTVVGDEAGTALTTGDSNVIVGMVAGDALTTASDNVAIGQGALTADTLGSKTVAIGRQALTTQNFTTATDTYNTAVGYHAGLSVTTGVQNTIVGGNAGDALTDADFNTVLGYAALSTDTMGSRSTAVGYGALNAQNFSTATQTDNTAVGSEAGGAITTGVQNTLLGSKTGDALTTGESNVALGYAALSSDDVGNHTVAVGHGALFTQNYATGTDSNNTAVGYNSGNAVTTATQNTFVGAFAGDGTDDGAGNTAVGSNSLSANCGSYNTAVGYLALEDNTAASNSAFGHQTLKENTSGYNNACFGTSVAYNNTEGHHLTAMGSTALASNTTGTYNTAVGMSSMDSCTTGYSNVAVGYNSLGALTEASGVVAVGNSAGVAHTTVAGGVYIGHVAGFNSTAQNTCIGYASAYSSNGPTSLSSGGGNTLIGSYTGVSGATNTGTVVIGHSATGKGTNTGFINPTSGVYQGNNSSSWSTTSDRRIKKNITDSSIGLAELNQIQVRNFEYKTKDELAEVEADGLVETDIIEKEGVQVGSIAQEIQAILPDCVTEQDTGVLAVNPDNLTWHLIKAVQELSAKNDALEARIVKLEG